MELELGSLVVINVIDVIICFILFQTLVAKRFNCWSETEGMQFEGCPRDYINDRVFNEFSGLYFLTLVAFAYALSVLAQIPDIRSFLETQLAAEFKEESSLRSALFLALNIGSAAITPYLIVVIMLTRVEPFQEIDQQWRGYLLGSARVPRDAMTMKAQIKDAVGELDLSDPLLKLTVDQLMQRGLVTAEDLENTSLAYSVNPRYAKLLIAQNLYLVSINERFNNDLFPAADLERIKNDLHMRAELIAAIEKNGQRGIQEHISALEVDQSRLAEILAKSCLKAYPKTAQRLQVMKSVGLDTLSLGRKELNWSVPIGLVFFGIFLTTLVLLLTFLPLFDALGIGGPKGNEWFSMERVAGWTVGSSFSMLLAVGVGLVMNEALKHNLGDRSLLAYIMSFLSALAGSMIFFTFSTDSFSLPFIALAVNFALLSFNAIASRGQRILSTSQVLRKALQFALLYAIASAFLQTLSRILFWVEFSKAGAPVPEALIGSLPYFALFGFVRGILVAFLVSYVFMDCERVAIILRRKHVRKEVDEAVMAEVSGEQFACTMKDISQRGARLTLTKPSPVHLGQEIALLFGFGSVKGQVVSTEAHQIRVCFDDTQIANRQLRSFIQRL